MADAMLYEDYLRRQIERGDFGVAIVPALIAEGMANWMENQRDKVSVVRCRECKHYHTEEDRVKPMACDLFNFDVDEDDFCSRGLKK